MHSRRDAGTESFRVSMLPALVKDIISGKNSPNEMKTRAPADYSNLRLTNVHLAAALREPRHLLEQRDGVGVAASLQHQARVLRRKRS